ncbi:MAG: hypothetical protein F4X72_00840 [Dehalococcoidia bacterium]|nr:hypothetical protein [Dehalococcoidia bacterium]
MTFEVFTKFSRCSEVHGAHSNLKEAAACFSELAERRGPDLPIDPISQKYIYQIVAVDRKGNLRNFSNPEREEAESLELDPKSFETDIPGITTFYRVARLYYEALRLLPLTSINLEGLFDYRDKRRHFWTTDAGKGQALAYAQQAAFTLELSLKAYLEVLGKLASPAVEDTQKWQRHPLVDLFKLLTDDEQKQLEEWWTRSDARRNHFKGTLREFLTASNKLYMKWRYITDLKSTNLSIDILQLLSASEFLLSASLRAFKAHSPYKVNITTTVHPNQGGGDGKATTPPTTTLVEGRVRTVRVPDGFNPHSTVEVVIDSEHHQNDITVHFYKRNVSDYYDLEGERVSLVGEISADKPRLLQHASYLDDLKRESKYTSESLTLRGSVYDIRMVHSAFGGSDKVILALYDETFFTQVECFFVTDKERDMLKELQLGDRILISGQVTLLSGQPTILVQPSCIEKAAEEQDDRQGTIR